MNETGDSRPTAAVAGKPFARAAPGSPRSGPRERGTITGSPYRFLGATVLALLGLLAMAGVKSYRDLATARDIENNLRREISETRTRVLALTEQIDRIKNDPATLERIAREELGMVREGDVVIVLPGEIEPMASRR